MEMEVDVQTASGLSPRQTQPEGPSAFDRLTVRMPSKAETMYRSVPKPPGRVPPGPLLLPEWKDRPMDDKLPMVSAPKGTVVYARNRLGKDLITSRQNVDFDLNDPYLYQTQIHTTYEPLHDIHLKKHFQLPVVREQLHAQELITDTGEVKCSLKQFNDFRAYLNIEYRNEITKERILRDERDRFEKKQLEMLQQCEKGQDAALQRAGKSKRARCLYERKQFMEVQRAIEMRAEDERRQHRKACEQHKVNLRMKAQREQETKFREQKKMKMALEHAEFRCITLKKLKKQDEEFKTKMELHKYDRECNQQEQRGLWLEQKRQFQLQQLKKNKQLLENINEQRRQNIEHLEEQWADMRKQQNEIWKANKKKFSQKKKEELKKVKPSYKKIREKNRFSQDLYNSSWDVNSSLKTTLNYLKKRALAEQVQKEVVVIKSEEKELSKDKPRKKRVRIGEEEPSDVRYRMKRLREEVLKLKKEKRREYTFVKGVLDEIIDRVKKEMGTKKRKVVTSSEAMDTSSASSTQIMKMCAAHSKCMAADGSDICSTQKCICGYIVSDMDESETSQSLSSVETIRTTRKSSDIVSKVQDISETASKVKKVSDSVRKMQNISDSVSKVQEVSDSVRKMQDIADSVRKMQDIADSVSKVKDIPDSVSKVQDILDSVSKVQDISDSVSKVQDISDSVSKVQDISDSVSKVQDILDSVNKMQEMSDTVSKMQETVPLELEEEMKEGRDLPSESQEYFAEESPAVMQISEEVIVMVVEIDKLVVFKEPTDVAHQDIIVTWEARALVDHVLECVHEQLKVLSDLCSQRKHDNTEQLDFRKAQPDVSLLAMALMNKVLQKAEVYVKEHEEHIPPKNKMEDTIASTLMEFLSDLRWQKQAETENELPKKQLEKSDSIMSPEMHEKSSLPVSGKIQDVIESQTHQMMLEVQSEEKMELIESARYNVYGDGVSPIASDLVDKIIQHEAKRLAFSHDEEKVKSVSSVKVQQRNDLLLSTANQENLQEAITEEYNKVIRVEKEKPFPVTDIGLEEVRNQVDILMEEASLAGAERKAAVAELLRQFEEEGVSFEEVSQAADRLLEFVIDVYNTCIVQESQQTVPRVEVLKVISAGGLEKSSSTPKYVSVMGACLIFEMIKMQMQALLFETGSEDENQQTLYESITRALHTIASSQGGLESVAPNLIEEVLEAHSQLLLVDTSKLLEQQEFRNAAAAVVTMSAMVDSKTKTTNECLCAVADLLVDEILRIQTDLVLRDIQADLTSEEEVQKEMQKAMKNSGKDGAKKVVKEFVNLQKASINKEAEGARLRKEAIIKVITNALKSSNQEEAHMVSAAILVDNFLHSELKLLVINSHDDKAITQLICKAASEKLDSISEKLAGLEEAALQVGMTIACAQRQALMNKAQPIMEQKGRLVKKIADSMERVEKESQSDPQKMAEAVNKLLRTYLDALMKEAAKKPKRSDLSRAALRIAASGAVAKSSKTSVAKTTPRKSSKSSETKISLGKNAVIKSSVENTAMKKKKSAVVDKSNASSGISSSTDSNEISSKASVVVKNTLLLTLKNLIGDVCFQVPSVESSNVSSPTPADISSVSENTLAVVATTMVDCLLKDLENEESQAAMNASPHMCYCGCASEINITDDGNRKMGPCKDQCRCAYPVPEVVPHYSGQPLSIDPAVVSKGFRAISIQHLCKETNAPSLHPITACVRDSGSKESGGVKQSGSVLCAAPHELVNRNAFSDLHHPDVSTVDLMRGMSAASIERVFKDHETQSPDVSDSEDEEEVQKEQEKQSSINFNKVSLQRITDATPASKMVVVAANDSDPEGKCEEVQKVHEMKQDGGQTLEEDSSLIFSTTVEESGMSRTPSTLMDVVVPLKRNSDRSSGVDSVSEPSLVGSSSQLDDVEAMPVTAVHSSQASLNAAADEARSAGQFSRRSFNAFDISRSISALDFEQEPLDRRFSSCSNIRRSHGGSQAASLVDSRATLVDPSLASSKLSLNTSCFELDSNPNLPRNRSVSSVPLDAFHASSPLPKDCDSMTVMSLPGDLLSHDPPSWERSRDSSVRSSHASPDTSPPSSSSSQVTKRSLGKSLSDLLNRIQSFVSDMGSTSSSSKGSLMPPANSSTVFDSREED